MNMNALYNGKDYRGKKEREKCGMSTFFILNILIIKRLIEILCPYGIRGLNGSFV